MFLLSSVSLNYWFCLRTLVLCLWTVDSVSFALCWFYVFGLLVLFLDCSFYVPELVGSVSLDCWFLFLWTLLVLSPWTVGFVSLDFVSFFVFGLLVLSLRCSFCVSEPSALSLDSVGSVSMDCWFCPWTVGSVSLDSQFCTLDLALLSFVFVFLSVASRLLLLFLLLLFFSGWGVGWGGGGGVCAF